MANPCETCGFELWIPVTTLAVTDVGLYDDDRYPGRCMVSLREHHVHLDEVPPALMASFWRDVTSVGAALRSVVDTERVNYAVLGNAEPHVHCHVIPRGSPRDLVQGTAPWRHPDPPSPLPAHQREHMTAAIRRALEECASGRAPRSAD